MSRVHQRHICLVIPHLEMLFKSGNHLGRDCPADKKGGLAHAFGLLLEAELADQSLVKKVVLGHHGTKGLALRVGITHVLTV